MADVRLLREGLAANLSTIPGIQVSPYILANPTPPCAYVSLGPVEYDKTMRRGHDDWTFVVYVIVGVAAPDVASQQRLDRMLASSGAESVKEALESDPTLGGSADDVHVVSATGPQTYERDAVQGATRVSYLGVEFTVAVMA